MDRVLLIEDAEDFQLMVKKSLRGYDIECATSGADALMRLKRSHFDLILLDVGLPDTDGYKLCSEIFASNLVEDTPVFFLTGKSSIEDKVLGFSVGADDYIVKPFDPMELRARVEAKLRKKQGKKSKENLLRIGDIEINIPFQRVVIHEDGKTTELGLSPLEFKLLYYFANREDMVLSRTQLLEQVWGKSVYVLERTIDKHVSTLRQKLLSKTHTIKTVTGMGYKFQKA